MSDRFDLWVPVLKENGLGQQAWGVRQGSNPTKQFWYKRFRSEAAAQRFCDRINRQIAKHHWTEVRP